MKGLFVNCPACRNHVLVEAYLRPGTKFRCLCPHCGEAVDISCEPGRVIIKLTNKSEQLLRKTETLTDDEESDIIFMQP